MSEQLEMPDTLEIPAGGPLRLVRNLDDGKGYYFQARTPYEAMMKMRYTLSLKDGSAKNLAIEKTPSDCHLYMVYNGETYTTAMDWRRQQDGNTET